jgi:hypothetical protein
VLELFHAVSDPASARLRKWVVEAGLRDRVKFRNVFYPEVMRDLTARGGSTAPALWDGAQLVLGEEEIRRRLAALL